MSQRIFKYLESYSNDPIDIDRLIVSGFLYSVGINSVKNKILSTLLIGEKDDDHANLLEFLEIKPICTFEDLIELFEFVVSPADKVINGAVYTPLYIREYIIEETFKQQNQIEGLTVCDPACGCAGFLYNVAKKIKRISGRSYKDIFESNIFGLDIEKYSIERSEILLTLLAVVEGEDNEEFEFNLHIGNALDFNWNEVVPNFQGFHIVVGNPPYVCSRNMDERSLNLIYNWEVSKSGHPDLYIPFFQLGFESLKEGGVLGYITVNTFLKSVNGRALREYFANREPDIKIINFGGEQVFKNRNTYTCLCFIENKKGSISYLKSKSTKLNDVESLDFSHYQFKKLDNHDGWNLVTKSEDREFLEIIENTGKPFKNQYTTRNGIATLKNDIYKFIPIKVTEQTYTLKTECGRLYEIERTICRNVINANKINSIENLENNQEKIIFPYVIDNEKTRVISEEDMIDRFPLAYNYLLDHQNELATRDKGKRDYEQWYAFGRRQSLDINAFKLFFPHISERPTFVISEDRDLLFYNGLAVISNNLEELRILKIIMESDVFYRYIKATTKDYASGYISMSKNYIKNFGICELTENEKNRLLQTEEPERLLRQFYNLNDHYEISEVDFAQVAEPKLINND